MKKRTLSVQARRELRANIAKINQNRASLTELHDLIVKEKRGLTDEEKSREKALVAENDALVLRNTELLTPEYDESFTIQNENGMSEILRSMGQGRGIPAKYAYLRSQDGNLLIPLSIAEADNIYKRAAETQDASSVSPINPTTVGQLLEPLEKGLIFDKIGTHIQYGLQGTWNIPVVTNAVEATWEEENVEVGDSKINLDKITPTPHRVAISVSVSRRAINQSAGSILPLVQRQINQGLLRTLNKAFFDTTAKITGAPDGVFKNLTAATIEAGKEWKGLLAMKAAVGKNHVPASSTKCYVMSEATYWKLAATPRDSGSGLMCADAYMINGTPVYTTEYVDDDFIGYGDFGYLLCGFFGNVTIGVDTTSAEVQKANKVVYVLNADLDFTRLRKEAFTTAKLGAAAAA